MTQSDDRFKKFVPGKIRYIPEKCVQQRVYTYIVFLCVYVCMFMYMPCLDLNNIVRFVPASCAISVAQLVEHLSREQ